MNPECCTIEKCNRSSKEQDTLLSIYLKESVEISMSVLPNTERPC